MLYSLSLICSLHLSRNFLHLLKSSNWQVFLLCLLTLEIEFSVSEPEIDVAIDPIPEHDHWHAVRFQEVANKAEKDFCWSQFSPNSVELFISLFSIKVYSKSCTQKFSCSFSRCYKSRPLRLRNAHAFPSELAACSWVLQFCPSYPFCTLLRWWDHPLIFSLLFTILACGSGNYVAITASDNLRLIRYDWKLSSAQLSWIDILPTLNSIVRK